MQATSATSRSAPLISALDALLAATSAFKNLRAIALMGITLIFAILVGTVFAYLGASTGMPAIIGLGILLALLVGFYGISAVGILLMHEAQGQPSGSIMDAVLLSLFSSHRLIAVAILELLIVLAVGLVVAIVFFICKIPVVGPFLFTFALPLAAVVFGVLIFALFYIMLPLAGPAVWSGSSTFQTIARLNMIARSRLIPVVIQQFILFVIILFAAGIIFAIVGLGLATATSLSASIIGAGAGAAGFGGLQGMMHGMGSMGGGGHFIAGAIGGSVLFGVATIIPALIATKGLCIIYLNAIHGLDFTQAEAQLESGMTAVKKKAEEARDRARQMAEQQAQKARDAVAAAAAASSAASASIASAESASPAATATPELEATAPEVAAPALTCPGCGVNVAPDDVFCGECGYKLK